jgi:hypothetical protein
MMVIEMEVTKRRYSSAPTCKRRKRKQNGLKAKVLLKGPFVLPLKTQ